MKSHDALIAVAILVLIGTAASLDPCKKKRCPRGKVCVSVVSPCKNPPCARVAKCLPANTPSLCPRVFCALQCQKGYLTRYDHNGCMTCTCYKPCEGVKVSPQKECLAKYSLYGSRVVYKNKRKCTANGDPHYYTYDGAVIHYMGTGEFTMSQRSVMCPNLQDFQVVGYQQNMASPSVSYLMWIELRVVYSPTVQTWVKIGSALQIWVTLNHGIPVVFNAGDPMPPGISTINTLTGVVESNFGVVVQFDGIHEGTIWIPLLYNNCVDGLCGNADGIAANDFVNQPKVNCGSLPENKKYWCVGNSWRVGGPTDHEQTVDKVKLTCTARNKRKFNGLKYCGALKNKRGPFGKCLRRKGKIGQNSYSSCMFDTCANQKDIQLAKNLACESVEAFARDCGKLVQRNWRKKTGCLCPGELVWTTCGRDCTRTCRKPTINCSFKCVARCQCPRSRPFQEGKSCLDLDRCKKLKFWPQPV